MSKKRESKKSEEVAALGTTEATVSELPNAAQVVATVPEQWSKQIARRQLPVVSGDGICAASPHLPVCQQMPSKIRQTCKECTWGRRWGCIPEEKLRWAIDTMLEQFQTDPVFQQFDFVRLEKAIRKLNMIPAWNTDEKSHDILVPLYPMLEIFGIITSGQNGLADSLTTVWKFCTKIGIRQEDISWRTLGEKGRTIPYVPKKYIPVFIRSTRYPLVVTRHLENLFQAVVNKIKADCCLEQQFVDQDSDAEECEFWDRLEAAAELDWWCRQKSSNEPLYDW